MPPLALRRLVIAAAAIATAMVIARVALGVASVWTLGGALVPLVFVVTVAMEWAVDLDTEEGIAHLVFGKIQLLWDSAGAGFYGAMAVATFLRLEALTIRDEWIEAGSAGSFFRSELTETLIGFSAQSIENTVEASIWFLGWRTLPGVQAIGLGLACFAAYGLGRWAWPDEAPGDTIETAIERLTSDVDR